MAVEGFILCGRRAGVKRLGGQPDPMAPKQAAGALRPGSDRPDVATFPTVGALQAHGVGGQNYRASGTEGKVPALRADAEEMGSMTIFPARLMVPLLRYNAQSGAKTSPSSVPTATRCSLAGADGSLLRSCRCC